MSGVKWEWQVCRTHYWRNAVPLYIKLFLSTQVPEEFHPQRFWSSRSAMRPWICISNKLPGGADGQPWVVLLSVAFHSLYFLTLEILKCGPFWHAGWKKSTSLSEKVVTVLRRTPWDTKEEGTILPDQLGISASPAWQLMSIADALASLLSQPVCTDPLQTGLVGIQFVHMNSCYLEIVLYVFA